MKASFYHSIGYADDSKSFYTRQFHFYGSQLRQCSQAVPSLKADLTVHRLFCSCLSPFPAGYILSAFAGCAKDCGAFPVILSIIHSPVWPNHRTAFPEQRPIHPRTAAHAYIVPSGYPFHRQYHVMTEGGVQYPAYELIRNCFNVQPSGTVWCRQAATTVLRRVIHNYFS